VPVFGWHVGVGGSEIGKKPMNVVAPPLQSEIAKEDHATIHLRLTGATCDALSRLNVFVGYDERYSPNPNRVIRIPKAAKFEEYTSFLGDTFHTIGALSYSETANLTADVGRYCSIATGFWTFGERHPIERVTSSSITYCFGSEWNKPQFIRAHRTLMGERYQPDFDGIVAQHLPILEHDVWIGQHVQAARGITIGTGAVVAAGSVVTKSVPPYTIVGGNPAKPIRMRFPVEIATRLLATKWWEYHPEMIWKLGYRDPEEFCAKFERAMQHGDLVRYQFRQLTWRDVVAEIAVARCQPPPTANGPEVVILNLDFSRGGNARPYLGAGWSDAETDFTWTENDDSYISFDTPREPGTYVMRITASGIINKPDLPTRQLTVFINTMQVAHIVCDVADQQFNEFKFTHEAFGAAPHTTLRLHHPDAVRPSDLGPSADTRRLAFSLKHLTLVHLPLPK
jgi:acetyltransferase-like isoleucine patch superfamily enzyme